MFESISGSGFEWYSWVILPILVFFSRVADVTLGTIRIIFISRGLRKYASILGFFEVLIWIVIIGQLVQNLQSITAYICYAGGFAMGNFVGMKLEKRIAFGTCLLRIITPEGGSVIMKQLHDAGFGVTSVDAQGTTGPVIIIYTVVKRRDMNLTLDIIHTYAPTAFVTIEDVTSAERGFFNSQDHRQKSPFFGRKSK